MLKPNLNERRLILQHLKDEFGQIVGEENGGIQFCCINCGMAPPKNSLIAVTEPMLDCRNSIVPMGNYLVRKMTHIVIRLGMEHEHRLCLALYDYDIEITVAIFNQVTIDWRMARWIS